MHKALKKQKGKAKGPKKPSHFKRGVKMIEDAGRAAYAAMHKCVLSLVEPFLLSSGSAYAYKHYHTNDVWDPAITGSGTNMPGRAALADMYFNFRVTFYEGSLTVINKETFPVGVYLLHTNTDPGSLGANYVTAAGQQFGQSTELGSVNGNSKHVFRFRHTIIEVVGSMAPRYEDNYSGALASSSPTDLTWLSIQASSMGAGNLTNGVQCITRLNLHTLCYGRLADITTFSQHNELNVKATSQALTIEQINIKMAELQAALSQLSVSPNRTLASDDVPDLMVHLS